jgi:hypothetical protein
MSEQLDGTKAPVVQLDMVVSHGTPTWDGNRLTFRPGLLAGKTVTLSMDALRSVYLFFPKEFKWRLVQSSEIYHYVDLDTLDEQGLVELQNLPTQYRFMMGSFQFVLTGMDGRVVKVSWKSLAAAGLDPLAELGRYRAARLEARARWLQQNPSTVLGSSGLSMNAAGVRGNRSRFIPWYALGGVHLQELRSLYDVCTFTLTPIQGSEFKTIAASAPPKNVEAFLAEMHFWTAHGVKGPGVGAVAARSGAEAAPPPPPAAAWPGPASSWAS